MFQSYAQDQPYPIIYRVIRWEARSTAPAGCPRRPGRRGRDRRCRRRRGRSSPRERCRRARGTPAAVEADPPAAVARGRGRAPIQRKAPRRRRGRARRGRIRTVGDRPQVGSSICSVTSSLGTRGRGLSLLFPLALMQSLPGRWENAKFNPICTGISSPSRSAVSGVRNLPKIDRGGRKAEGKQQQQQRTTSRREDASPTRKGGEERGGGGGSLGTLAEDEEQRLSSDS